MEATKPVIRGIKLGGTLRDKVSVICQLKFPPIPDNEFKTLLAVISFSTNNTLAITPDVSKQIKFEFTLTDTVFTTSLFRLEKKGFINRQGKTVIINPAFTEIDKLDKLVISFQSSE